MFDEENRRIESNTFDIGDEKWWASAVNNRRPSLVFSDQENYRRASGREEIGRRFTVHDVFICSSSLFVHSCQP